MVTLLGLSPAAKMCPPLSAVAPSGLTTGYPWNPPSVLIAPYVTKMPVKGKSGFPLNASVELPPLLVSVTLTVELMRFVPSLTSCAVQVVSSSPTYQLGLVGGGGGGAAVVVVVVVAGTGTYTDVGLGVVVGAGVVVVAAVVVGAALVVDDVVVVVIGIVDNALSVVGSHGTSVAALSMPTL